MEKKLIIKYVLVINFVLFALFIFADNIYSQFDYNRLTGEPIKWGPEGGIFFNTVKLDLSCDYGKIYYLINSEFNKREPKEYKDKIILKGENGSIVDYNVLAILENVNGTIELYSRTYRIDKTGRYEKKYYQQVEEIKKNVQYLKDKVNLQYEFPENDYNISFFNREFVFSQETILNTGKTANIDLNIEKNKKLVYLINIAYKKDGKIYNEVQTQIVDLNITKPPTLGSLYWGQVYKHSSKIEIKPYEKEDKIYYWVKEWEKEDLIFGAPSKEKLDDWTLYSSPIELETKYGLNGITGIAAFSIGINGQKSEITGPFYFKINGIEKTFEQVFIDKNTDDKNKKSDNIIENKKILLNNQEYKGTSIIEYGKVILDFKNYTKDDRFYFTFKSRLSDGKSDLLPCDGGYIFRNIIDQPVEFKIYLSNGSEIASFEILGDKMILPVMKKYFGNNIRLVIDEIVDFFMPKNLVRYEVTADVDKILNIKQESPVFTGKLKISTDSDEEKIYKIKFGAFDDNNNLIAESEDLFFKINKKILKQDIILEGIDIGIHHNEKQILKLIPPDENLTVYYRFNDKSEWILYDNPVEFYPPSNGKYSMKIYTKYIDEFGNQRENGRPFEMLFDTRALFIDPSKQFSGNGTESSPYKSLEQAILNSKEKNIKIIHILADEIKLAVPLKIESDIIIEPYIKDKRTRIIMETKSLWKKNYTWFDINKDGYFEIRNTDFTIKSGNGFINLDSAKIKLYNLKFEYSGTEEFCFIKNEKGKIGINTISFFMTNFNKYFNFFDSSNSSIILDNIKLKLSSMDAVFFKLNNIKNLNINFMDFDILVSNSFNFALLNNSDVSIKNLILNQAGNYDKTTIFNMNNSNLSIEESDFVLEGKNAFDTKVAEQKISNIKVIKSLFWIKNSVSTIAFNLINSNIYFEKSIINIENTLDYSYNFRAEDSSIKLYSSVIKNSNCLNTITFVLNNTIFEGANNSIFNIDVKERGINFWVTETAKITTINSIYYFNNQNEKSALIYFNNNQYDNLKPFWLSNIIMTNVILLENLDKKDSEFIINDFNEKNIFFNLKDQFDLKSTGFFIPIIDSPILQGGLPDYLSPIKIPDKDIFNRNRIVSGYGIDIGAVQKSGNF